jgi:hypothetical protein
MAGGCAFRVPSGKWRRAGRTPQKHHATDVYCTVGEPSLFSRLVSEDHSECLVEQAVNAHLAATLLEAEAVLLKKFEMVTIAMLAGEFETSALRSKSSRAGNK